MDPARIRNNQRKSRARRKEYLHEVEERLRDFERLGVEASLELQSAARRVADENTRLRSLLKLRGVTDLEINEHLQNGNVGSRSDGRIVDCMSNGLSAHVVNHWIGHGQSQIEVPAQHMSQGVVAMEHQYQVIPTYDGTLPPPRANTESSTRLSHSTSPRKSDNDENTTLSEHDDPDHVVMHDMTQSQDAYSHPWNKSDSSCKADNATSCVLAATIIAGMRLDKTSEEVRAELGCALGVECEIDNVKIFGIMDR
ncbi:hypothetical protein MMC13_002217 [Lambiella insularis]|nr:hypothetical protein [Lambiella insularis]